MNKHRVYVLGAGITGAIVARLFWEFTDREVFLIGPQELPSELGPRTIWATPETGYLFGKLPFWPPEIRKIKVFFWNGREITEYPTTSHVKYYNIITTRDIGTVMSDGKTEIDIYDISWKELYHNLLETASDSYQTDQGYVSGFELCQYENYLSAFKMSTGNLYSIDDNDYVFCCFDYRNLNKMLGLKTQHTSDSHRKFYYSRLEHIPFDWPSPNCMFMYILDDDNLPGIYRITNQNGEFIAESYCETIGDLIHIAYSPKGSCFVPLDEYPHNLYLMGRSARGDRSRIHDVIRMTVQFIQAGYNDTRIYR